MTSYSASYTDFPSLISSTFIVVSPQSFMAYSKSTSGWCFSKCLRKWIFWVKLRWHKSHLEMEKTCYRELGNRGNLGVLLVSFNWVVDELVLAEVRRVGEGFFTKVTNVIFLLSVRSERKSSWLFPVLIDKHKILTEYGSSTNWIGCRLCCSSDTRTVSLSCAF